MLKRLYARVVLALIQPAINLDHERRNAELRRHMNAWDKAIRKVAAGVVSNNSQ